MKRKEQLAFCRICTNKSFHPDKGIVCKLTGDVARFELSCPDFSENKEITRYQHAEEEPGLSEVLGVFKLVLKGKFVATPMIMLGCIVLYLVMLSHSSLFLIPDISTLTNFGANVKPYTIHGEYWRLITAIFLHGSPDHLIANMYAFLSVGFFLERLIGSMKFSLLFLVSSLAASVSSIIWDDMGLSVGASGAIFGMFGVYIILLTTKIMERMTRLVILLCISVYVIYNIILTIGPGIDYAAHIGGLLSGLIIGLSIRPMFVERRGKVFAYMMMFAGIFIILSASYLGMKNAPTPLNTYQSFFLRNTFDRTKALDIYERYKRENYDAFSRLTLGNVMPTFRNCKRRVALASKVEGLPDSLYQHLALEKEYYDYSLRKFELSLLRYQGGSIKYGDAYDMFERRTALLADKLNGLEVDSMALAVSPLIFLLERIPENFLILYDGKPILTHEEYLSIDPLSINGSSTINDVATKKLFGIDAAGSLSLESREAALRRVQEMPQGRKRRIYMQIYGLRPLN